MSTLYDTTDNYALNLYGDDDPADLRDGYNGSMGIIDGTLKNHIDRIAEAEATLKTKLDAVAHDETLRGAGTSADQLKVNLNHDAAIRDDGTAVYPAVMYKEETGADGTGAARRVVQGIGFSTGAGLTAYHADGVDADNALKLSDEVRASIEKSETRVFDITSYKEPNETDYTNAWNRIFNRIEGGAVVYFPAGTYDGTFVVSKPHVAVKGSGIIRSTIHVNVASTNTEPDMTVLDGLTIQSGGSPCIELHHTVGCTVTNCNLMAEGYDIIARDVPNGHQWVRQFNISNNHFSGKCGIYFKPDGANPNRYYLGADGIISGNEMVNTVHNVVIHDTDGINIRGNVMFLSTGGMDRLQNIILDNVSFSTIAGNELFEAGSSAIQIGDNNGTVISGNNIVWAGQCHEEAAIKFSGGNVQGGSTNQPCNNLIVGNRIEHCSAYAVWNESKTHNAYIGNYMYEVGSAAHYVGTHSGTKYPAIHDTKTCVCIGNSTRADKIAKSYDIPNNVNCLSFNDAGMYITDKSWTWNPVSQHINKKTTSIIRHRQGDVLIISETDGTFQKTEEEFLTLGAPTVTPYIGYVLSFDGRNKIGETALTANKIVPYMIFDNMVKFFA